MYSKSVIKKKWLIVSILWCILVGCVVFFHILSTQSGEASVRLSYPIAVKIADILYNNPSSLQIEDIHRTIRLLAHVVTFFILGFIGNITIQSTFSAIWVKKNGIAWLIFAGLVVFNICYSFFDEWQKQFISGRHNMPLEGAVNAVAGIVGIIIAQIIFMKGMKRYEDTDD